MDATAAVATDAQEHLLEHGYVVLEGLISADEVTRLRDGLEGLMARERAEPFEPGDGPAYAEEEEHATRYAQKAWARQSTAEQERLLRRLRHTRAENFDTPWPVGIAEVCGCFRHFPSLYDDDRSQRVFNLINKLPEFAVLVEHPVILEPISALLGRDCILLDVSASSVGPDTEGGDLHIDSPITYMVEPLPDLTLSIQAVWMLTDFTIENGASRVVPGTHRSQRKPFRPHRNDEVVLTGPAGSVAVWLSQTWHRHGPNASGSARPGVICQYGRSWVKPFVDLRSPLTAETAPLFSPRLRYMMGCGSTAPVRG